MLTNENKVNNYQEEVRAKLKRMLQKAPIEVSLSVTAAGIVLEHSKSHKVFQYPWDYKVPACDFIAQVKKDLIQMYPVLLEIIQTYHKTSPDEAAKLISEGSDLSQIPEEIADPVIERYWRLDKVILWNNSAILVQLPEDGTGTYRRYKMRSPLILYLKKYREGNWTSLQDASREFFSKAELMYEKQPASVGNAYQLKDQSK